MSARPTFRDLYPVGPSRHAELLMLLVVVLGLTLGQPVLAGCAALLLVVLVGTEGIYRWTVWRSADGHRR